MDDPFDFPPFRPPALWAHPLVMTVAGSLPRRESGALATSGRERIFETVGGNRVQARCHPQERREAPCVILLHGLVSDLQAPYIVGTADKAFALGFHAVRLNARNCGGTEPLAVDSYHGGLTEDLRSVAEQLAREGVGRIYLVGFSLGGNMALKLAAEVGERPPEWLGGVATLSPCVDFAASAAALDRGWFNRWCQRRFLRELRNILRRRPELLARAGLDPSDLPHLESLRAFDDRFTAPLGGFADVDDYYRRASAGPLLDRVRVPSLLVASRDDPLVPFATLERPEIRDNPWLRVLASARGGHTAFLGRRPPAGGLDADRRWGEARLVRFCHALEHAGWGAGGFPPAVS